jgi:hypothetical protein
LNGEEQQLIQSRVSTQQEDIIQLPIKTNRREDDIKPWEMEERRKFERSVQRRAQSLVICPQQGYLREPIARLLEEDRMEREKRSALATVMRFFRKRN